MIINDLQRLRWQILDECLRDPKTEYFMGEDSRHGETETLKSLVHTINRRLKEVDRTYKTGKRILQKDLLLFQQKGLHLVPNFMRGHKRVLRYRNLKYRNPLLGSVLMPRVTDGLPTLRTLAEDKGKTELVIRLGATLRDQYADISDKNGILTLHTEITPDVRRLVFGYGKELEVLQPESLRAEIRQIVNELFKLYRKDSGNKKKKGEQLDMFGDLFG